MFLRRFGIGGYINWPYITKHKPIKKPNGTKLIKLNKRSQFGVLN